MENILYYGDNLDILRRYIPDESIDLVYLDPPFKSNQSYNILFKEKNGTNSAAQIKVFEDTWHWDRKAEETYIEITEEAPQRVADLIIALRRFLGSNDMMAYLVMMAIRLVELHRVLRDTGSIYLHCDPTASHYLKLVMDSVYGVKNYRNEIIWKRYSSHGNVYKNYGKIHDTIFFYTKTDKATWNQPYKELNKEYIEKFFRHIEPKTRRRYRLQNVINPNKDRPNLTYKWHGYLRVWKWTKEKMQELHNKGKLYYTSTGYPQLKQYLDESKGQKVQDVWDDIKPLSHSGRERLGYPTQKPESLIERIIETSSNEGNIVLDPFCGCGTTITVAEKLKRKWIGIDITHLAISLMRHRLRDTFGDRVKYKVVGEPVDLKGAEELAKQDPYQFQWWALGLVGARPADSEKKMGKDRGIDGYIYFHDEPQRTKKIVIQVKSGHVNPAHIRDLRGVVERENAQIGVFITLLPPTTGMKKEALSAGFYRSPGWGKAYPKIQIFSIEELFSGKSIEYPPKTSVTFKKAEKHNVEESKQLTIKEEG